MAKNFDHDLSLLTAKQRKCLTVGLVLLAIYLPYFWVLSVHAPWSDRLHWIKLWPVLPGIITMAFFSQLGALAWPLIVLAPLGLISGASYLGIKHPQKVPWVLGVTFIVSCLLSFVAYGLFKA